MTPASRILAFDVNETLLDLSPLDARFERHLGDGSLRGQWFAQMLQLSSVGAITDQYRLVLPFASAVPAGTPAPPAIVAGTGPYRIAAFEPGRRIRLERNRFYRPWSALARPDGYPDVIDARLGVKASEAIGSIRAGRRDVANMGTGYAELARLRRRDPGPIRDTVSAATTWIFLNTHVPPFDEVDARRAVSLAIDRRAVVAAAGRDAVRATCHIIPPGLPGYRPDCPPRGAMEAVSASRSLGVVWEPACRREPRQNGGRRPGATSAVLHARSRG